MPGEIANHCEEPEHHSHSAEKAASLLRRAERQTGMGDSSRGLAIQDIIDALPFYVLLIDEDHYILQANKAVYTHLGIAPEQTIGKYCPKAIHGLDEPYHGCPLEESAEKGVAVIREVFDEHNGQWVSSAIFPTGKATPEGKRIFFHMVTDITQRKKAEEQVKASNERLRGITTHLESVREEERRRIARDLHDETSQILVSLNAYLEAATGTLPASATKAKATLRKAQSLSVKILDAIQQLILELHPPLLDDMGLSAAISSLLESTLETKDIKAEFQTVGEARRMDLPIETTLFRVIQEAVNNIARHSGAKNAVVRLEFGSNTVRINIRDDGKGFEAGKTDSKDSTRGFGLLSMKERVELLNGTLKISSTPGHGTEIEAEIPLSSEGAQWEK